MSYSAVALLTLDQSRVRNILVSNVYSDINSAVNGVPDDALLLIEPGTYTTTGRLDINKKLGLLGYGGRPVIQNGNRYAHENNLLGGAHVVAENVTFRSPTSQPWITALFAGDGPNISLLAHRVKLERGHANSHVLRVGYNHPPGALRFQHCTLERGYNTLYGGDLNAVSLSRCYTPNYSTFLTSGTLNLDDKVLTETEGYGHESGVPLIDLNDSLVNISSRVVDLRPALSPRVVLFDWLHPDRYCVPGQMAADGHWSDAFVGRGVDFGVYYLSRDNRCTPIIHGPYTAE